MRTVRFTSSVISTIVVLATVIVLGSLSSAYSEEDKLKAVYPNKIARSVNQVCPQGSVKLFTVKFTVPRGTRIVRAREFMLLLKSGDVLNSQAYRVNGRQVEYTLPARRRAAQVDIRDMRHNLAYATYTSHTYTVRLGSMCLEEPDPME